MFDTYSGVETRDLYERIREGEFDSGPASESYTRFKQAALEYVGLVGHERAEKIYSYAWQQGHSGGYSEVLNVLVEVAEIFED